MNIENLKKAREDAGMTQAQAAAAIGVSDGTYKNYEQGKREPNGDKLVTIANKFCVTTDYLLGRPNPNKTDPIEAVAKAYRLTSAQKGILAAYLYMDDSGRENLLDIVKRLADGAETLEDKLTVSRMFRKHLNKASAGTGYDLDNDDNWETIRIKDDPIADDADFIVEVDGDSMEPNYHSGDLVFVKLSIEVPMNHVGMFRKGESGYIKRRGKDCLISDNPDYEDIYPDTEPIECIGIVLGTAKQL